MASNAQATIEKHLTIRPVRHGAARRVERLLIQRNDMSKGLQGGLFVFLDVEQFVELGDLEDFEDLVVDIAHHQLAAGRIDFLVEGDELAQGGAGEILDIAEIQQDFLAAQLIDQAEKVFADLLDVLLVEDLACR